MHLSAGRSRLLLALSVMAPAVVLLIVWLPVGRQYSVPSEFISDESLEAARNLPTDEVLGEARSFYLYPIPNRQPNLEIAIADGMLDGRLQLPGGGSTDFSLKFSPEDLERVPPGLRLWIASYAVPDFLLAAYVETRREEYFTAAQDYILDWGAYERLAWIPKGLLWNDHAIASRVRVLGEFWRLYRKRPDYEPEVGKKVLRQAARYGEFLSDPAQFTFATNHGVMQNLGLMHLALAFPTLPNSGRLLRVATERMEAQMAYYMGQDGVIRENSAGYQAFGLELLGMSFRSLTLLETPVPAEWAYRYYRGFEFLAQLRRPDGTLPASGDTDGASLASFPRIVILDSLGRSGPLQGWSGATPDSIASLFPSAGYWIEWDGLEQWPDQRALRQTMMTWTSPPPPAHKHADDLAVWLWSDGISWLTSVGYWPYDVPGRDEAVSWPGSNAPHARGESRESIRSTRLLGSARTETLTAIEVERTGPGEYVARRLLLHVKPDIWIIADHVHSVESNGNSTVWTLSPLVQLQPLAATGSFIVQAPGSAVALHFHLLGSPGTRFESFYGSMLPLAGWQVVDGRPQPANAIAVQQPAGDSWLFSVLSRVETVPQTAGVHLRPQVLGASSAEEWSLRSATGPADFHAVRRGQTITITHWGTAGTTTDSLELTPAPSTALEDDAVRIAFEKMAQHFPRFQDLIVRRTKVTWIIALLFAVQEAILFVARRRSASLAHSLRLLSVFAWIGIGMWLHLVFLVSWSIVPSNWALLLPIGWPPTRRCRS